jgi:hypothetical protein
MIEYFYYFLNYMYSFFIPSNRKVKVTLKELDVQEEQKTIAISHKSVLKNVNMQKLNRISMV